MTIRVVVAGATGWTGSALTKALLTQSDMLLAGAVARQSAGQDIGEALGLEDVGIRVSRSLEEALEMPSDVVVDYTKADAVKRHVALAIREGRHVVVGSSGLGAEDYREIDGAAREKDVGVVAAGNFSITATLLKRFALLAANYVPDVEVIDYAGAGKIDAPSGTARELAEMLSAVRGRSTARPLAETIGPPEARGAAIGEGGGVQVHSLRLPSYVIACEALFGLPDERLTIRHDAGASAAPYVAGTLLAIRKVTGVKGLVRGLDGFME